MLYVPVPAGLNMFYTCERAWKAVSSETSGCVCDAGDAWECESRVRTCSCARVSCGTVSGKQTENTGLAGQMSTMEVGRAIHVDCQVEVAPEPSTHLLSLGHYYLPRLP